MKKKFLHQLLSPFVALILCTTMLTAQFAPNGMQPKGLPQMSPEELQAFDQELERIMKDPQAMQEYAELGERLMQEDPEFKQMVEELTKAFEEEFKKEGYDLNQLPQQPAPQPTPTTPSMPVEEPKEVAPAKPTISKKTIKEIKNILETIAEKLADVRQKALEDTTLKKLFEPWEFHVDDLIYYANALQEEHLIKYLAQKEFEQLYETLKEFARILQELEPNIEPREFSLDQESPYATLEVSPTASFDAVQTAYRKQLQQHKAPTVIESQMNAEGREKAEIAKAKKQAGKERSAIEKAFKKIRTYEESKENLKKLLEFDVRTVVQTQNVKEQIKKLLATYEPEAVKARQATEKEQEEARKKQEEATRRFPPYSPPTFYTPPLSQYPTGGYPGYQPPYYPDTYTPPATTPAPAEEALKLDENGKKKAAGRPGGKAGIGSSKSKDKIDVKEPDKKRAKLTEDADPEVEKVITALQVRLEDIANKLVSNVGDSQFNPEELFDANAFKKAIKDNEQDRLKAISNSITELITTFDTAKKTLERRKSATPKLTFSQKNAVQKRATELFSNFEKDQLTARVPALMQIKEDPTDKKLKIDDQEVPIKAIPDFLRSYTDLKKEIATFGSTGGSAPQPPAPAAAGS